MNKAFIVSTGYYLPKKILTNDELAKMVDTSDEWITSRTGIKERHIAAKNESSADMGIRAARNAMKNGNIKPEEIDAIICATITPDYCLPATACVIQKELELVNAFAFDISAACSGFIYALSIAESFILQNKAQCVLVIATEKMSSITNWEDRATCILFGDGAGAAIVKKTNKDKGVLSSYLGSDGSLFDLLIVPAGGTRMPITEEVLKEKKQYIQMKGNEVFKVAVTRMIESAKESLKRSSLKCEDIKVLIPHQANLRIINAITKRLELEDDQVIITLDKTGNTSAASIALSLAMAEEEKKIKKNDIIMLVSFGAGFTWAGMIIKW